MNYKGIDWISNEFIFSNMLSQTSLNANPVKKSTCIDVWYISLDFVIHPLQSFILNFPTLKQWLECDK